MDSARVISDHLPFARELVCVVCVRESGSLEEDGGITGLLKEEKGSGSGKHTKMQFEDMNARDMHRPYKKPLGEQA